MKVRALIACWAKTQSNSRPPSPPKKQNQNTYATHGSEADDGGGEGVAPEDLSRAARGNVLVLPYKKIIIKSV